MAVASAALLAALPGLADGWPAAAAGALSVMLLAGAMAAARPQPVRWALLALLAAYGIPWGAPGVPWWAVMCAPLTLVVGELAFWSLDLAAVMSEEAELTLVRARRLAAVTALALACGVSVSALSSLGAVTGSWPTTAGAAAAGALTVWLGRAGIDERA